MFNVLVVEALEEQIAPFKIILHILHLNLAVESEYTDLIVLKSKYLDYHKDSHYEYEEDSNDTYSSHRAFLGVSDLSLLLEVVFSIFLYFSDYAVEGSVDQVVFASLDF